MSPFPTDGTTWVEVQAQASFPFVKGEVDEGMGGASNGAWAGKARGRTNPASQAGHRAVRPALSFG